MFTSEFPWLQLKALLHGHSYSAHAIGCSAAVQSIKWFKNSQRNVNLIPGADLLREVGHMMHLHCLNTLISALLTFVPLEVLILYNTGARDHLFYIFHAFCTIDS